MTYYKFDLNSDNVDGICDVFNLQKISLLRSFTQATGIQLLLREYSLEHNANVKIFNEEDVINIFPVVKHINPRATDAYNFYTTGQSKIQQGYLKVSNYSPVPIKRAALNKRLFFRDHGTSIDPTTP